jgi:hypothetical protein
MALLTAAGRAFLLMWGEAAAADSPLRDIFAERDTWFCNVLRSYVADGVREGSVRADADPAAAAAAIMSQLRGIGLELMINPDAPPADAVRRETVIMVRRACRPEAPAAPAGRPYWG